MSVGATDDAVMGLRGRMADGDGASTAATVTSGCSVRGMTDIFGDEDESSADKAVDLES